MTFLQWAFARCPLAQWCFCNFSCLRPTTDETHWTLQRVHVLLTKFFFIKGKSLITSLSGVDSDSTVRRAISGILDSQVPYQLCYCKRDEVYFTTLQWQNNGRQNGIYAGMLLSELYKTMANEIIFVGFKGAITPPGSTPCSLLTSLFCRHYFYPSGFHLFNFLQRITFRQHIHLCLPDAVVQHMK